MFNLSVFILFAYVCIKFKKNHARIHHQLVVGAPILIIVDKRARYPGGTERALGIGTIGVNIYA